MSQNKILVVYIEPAPYITGLINHLTNTWPSDIDVLFLYENLSQDWNMTLSKQWKVLPKNRLKQFYILTKLIYKNNYAFIHFAGWGNLLFMWSIFFAYLNRIPVSLESDTPLHANHSISIWKRLIKRIIYPFLFNKVQLFLPGGKKQAQYLNYYGVKNENIVQANMTVDVTKIKNYISNLSDSDRFEIRQQFGIASTSITFLFVGRLIQHKGISDLINAFKMIKEKDVTLLIVGDGDMRSQIETIAKENNKIIYLGRLTDSQLHRVYFAADVVVLPSHFEPWGLVVNEAMAAGKPIIVSDSVGCAYDLINSYKSGIIVKTKCVNSLYGALEYMCHNNRYLMQKHASEAIESWTLENEAKIMCQAWQRLINV